MRKNKYENLNLEIKKLEPQILLIFKLKVKEKLCIQTRLNSLKIVYLTYFQTMNAQGRCITLARNL